MTLPFVTGAIGLLGTKPSSDMMEECDTLLMIGTGFPWAEFLPKDGQARAIQIDIASDMLGLRYPVEVNLHGDAVETLRALLPLIHRKTDRAWEEAIARQMVEWRETLEGRAIAEAHPVHPQRVVYEMSPRLPDNALAADRPVLIEVKTDPNVAPLPPHVTLAQAKTFMSSMKKDRNAMDVIADTARQVIEGIRERL